MAKAQNGWRKLSGSGQRKIEKFVALGDRGPSLNVQVLNYIKTWQLTGAQVAVERGTHDN